MHPEPAPVWRTTKIKAFWVRICGVTFEEARDAILDPRALQDRDASHGDDREWLIGQSGEGRTLFLVLFEGSDDTVRIISARRATAHERRLYEG